MPDRGQRNGPRGTSSSRRTGRQSGRPASRWAARRPRRRPETAAPVLADSGFSGAIATLSGPLYARRAFFAVICRKADNAFKTWRPPQRSRERIPLMERRPKLRKLALAVVGTLTASVIWVAAGA